MWAYMPERILAVQMTTLSDLGASLRVGILLTVTMWGGPLATITLN